MNERMIRFIELLNQMFELDKSDLDFGIYRILNIRRKEIQKFFTEGLPRQIRETLEPFAQGNKDELRKQIAEIEQQAAAFGASPENNPKYKELKAQLQQGTDLSALESDVYSALYNFFSRYYDEGDFISKRRYKEGVYAIPYEGEEVKLYWANQDQYYIKTSENFKDYTFTAGDYTVHFLLVDATTEQNNNKEDKNKKREFMLFTEDEEKYPGVKTFEYNEEEKTVNIRFIFDVPKEAEVKTDEEGKKKKKVDYSEKNKVEIKQWLSTQPTAVMLELLRITNPDAKAKDQISFLDKHLKAYVAKNTFDYFIHKDLGGFLSRELDFFIKNEVMHLDDLDTENEARVETYIAKVRAIKQVGRVIIKFLAQIENFQKKLWLKKKFVVETNWCITLDRIPEEYYDEIRQNKAQVQEWIDMYAIDEIQPDLEHTEPFTPVPSVLFLKQNQNLIVDTKYFSEEFKNKLLAEFDDLDKETGGLMINSDNFQANRLIEVKFKNEVNCIYLDPPYNTGPTEILYKNNYKDSSWLSLMKSRFESMKNLMSDDCAVAVAIDDYEMVRMSEMLTEEFPNYERNMIIVNHHPQGTPKDNISRTHEYSVVMTPLGDSVLNNSGTIDGVEHRPLMRSGSADNNYRYGRPNSFFAILVDPKTKQIMGAEQPPQFGFKYDTSDTPEGWKRVYPIGKDGTERVWRMSYNTGKINYKWDNLELVNSLLWCSPDSFTLYQIVSDKKEPINSNWVDKRYNAGTYGTKMLRDMFGKNPPFDYPKSLYTVEDYIKAATNSDEEYLILDYFGGSGTTGHAVLDLNSQDNGSRKYILVDMAEYFSKATHPRVKKAIYSLQWKDGKPLSHKQGVSHMMKYFRLEQYEDALNNIQLKKDESLASLFGDDYNINYMFDLEAKGSLLNLDAFKAPFSYEMNITEKNEMKLRKVDVCETFNYLIGLTVKHQGIIRSYDSLPAAKPMYEGAVDLVKGTQFAFRQIEGTLPDGRKALVIWRTISDDLMASNAALDAYFEKYRINPLDREYDIIYVNGDNNLENLRTSDESWKVVLTEQEFNKRMFEEM